MKIQRITLIASVTTIIMAITLNASATLPNGKQISSPKKEGIPTETNAQSKDPLPGLINDTSLLELIRYKQNRLRVLKLKSAQVNGQERTNKKMKLILENKATQLKYKSEALNNQLHKQKCLVSIRECNGQINLYNIMYGEKERRIDEVNPSQIEQNQMYRSIVTTLNMITNLNIDSRCLRGLNPQEYHVENLNFKKAIHNYINNKYYFTVHGVKQRASLLCWAVERNDIDTFKFIIEHLRDFKHTTMFDICCKFHAIRFGTNFTFMEFAIMRHGNKSTALFNAFIQSKLFTLEEKIECLRWNEELGCVYSFANYGNKDALEIIFAKDGIFPDAIQREMLIAKYCSPYEGDMAASGTMRSLITNIYYSYHNMDACAMKDCVSILIAAAKRLEVTGLSQDIIPSEERIKSLTKEHRRSIVYLIEHHINETDFTEKLVQAIRLEYSESSADQAHILANAIFGNICKNKDILNMINEEIKPLNDDSIVEETEEEFKPFELIQQFKEPSFEQESYSEEEIVDKIIDVVQEAKKSDILASNGAELQEELLRLNSAKDKSQKSIVLQNLTNKLNIIGKKAGECNCPKLVTKTGVAASLTFILFKLFMKFSK